MELLGQRPQGLGQQGDFLSADGDFTHLGAEHHTGHTHDVTNIVLFESSQSFLAYFVNFDEELDAAFAILQVGENSLTHAALAQQTAGDGDSLLFQCFKICLDLFAVVGHIKLGDLEGVLSTFLKFSQLVAANLKQVRQRNFFLLSLIVILFFSHCSFSFVYRDRLNDRYQ